MILKNVPKLLVILAVMISVQGFAQTDSCSYLFNFQAGTLLKNVYYNQKQESYLTQLVKVVINDGKTLTLSQEPYQSAVSTIKATLMDVICDSNAMLYPFDEWTLIGNHTRDAKSDKYIRFPRDLKEGMTLPDATSTGKGYTDDGAYTYLFSHTNRQVAGFEQITTPAGTFECARINFTHEVTVKFMGMGKPNKWATTIWISPSAGIVKTEHYDKKGKFTDSIVLEKIILPQAGSTPQ